MDILAHAIYGATLCSRTGFAGGRTGTGRPAKPWFADSSVWWAVMFGLLPDAVSLGPPWLTYLLSDQSGSYWLTIDADDLTRYRYMHSLLVASLVAVILRRWRPALFYPSLAWVLHILSDALTHGAGRFQTMIFYPLSTWGLDSIRWWEHPRLVMGYWILLPLLWCGIWLGRQRNQARSIAS